MGNPNSEANREQITLRTGAVVERGLARAFYGMLTSLAEQDPVALAALLAIAQGRDANPALVARLAAEGLLPDHGQPRPVARAVLLAAFRDTPEGPVLVDPFRYNSAEDLGRQEALDNHSTKWLLRDIFRTTDGDDTPSPPPRT